MVIQASAGILRHQPQQNKALHPTAYSPLVPRFLPAAGELGRCGAHHLFESYTSRCEYSMRCIRVLQLYSRPATRYFAAGSPQPVIAPRLLTACATLQLPAAGEFKRSVTARSLTSAHKKYAQNYESIRQDH